MASTVARIAERLHDVAEDVERLRETQRHFRQSIPAYIRRGSWLNLATAPVIYSLIIPLALLDLWVSVYQWVCFPLYGITLVSRSSYFAIDRHKLAYLNGIEKINCTFCSYANGLIAYVGEIAARTEQYWCPIKHARRTGSAHHRSESFFRYGDAQAYRRDLPAMRQSLRRAGQRRCGGRS